MPEYGAVGRGGRSNYLVVTTKKDVTYFGSGSDFPHRGHRNHRFSALSGVASFRQGRTGNADLAGRVDRGADDDHL